jgi:hypothetical protein
MGSAFTGIGFASVESQDIQYLNCTATDNAHEGFFMTSSSVGFTNASRDIIINNCSSIGNHCHGFHAFNVQGGLTITGCQAQANIRSLNSGAGFLMEGPLNVAIIRDCTSQLNDIGFASSSAAFPVPGNNNYYSNVACNNTSANYVDVAISTIAPQNSAMAFQNVTC